MPPTTQQVINSLWTPAEVFTLIGLISGVFFTALGLLAARIIDAVAKAKIAVTAAETARLEAQAAATQSSRNQGATEQMSKQMDGIQTQVTAALLAAPQPTSPVEPVKFSPSGGTG